MLGKPGARARTTHTLSAVCGPDTLPFDPRSASGNDRRARHEQGVVWLYCCRLEVLMRPFGALVLLVGISLSGSSIAQRAAPTATTTKAVEAARAFLATLDQSQRAQANPPFNTTTRVVWSNLPTGITMQVGATERNGVKLGAMTPAQEKAAWALLGAVLSPDGLGKVMQDRS